MSKGRTGNGPRAGSGDEAAWCEISIRGRLDPRWSAWFDGATLTHTVGGTTIVRVHVNDQAALHGLIQKVGDLGLELVSVTHDGPGPTNQPPAAEQHDREPTA
jgi:hypothetical protein